MDFQSSWRSCCVERYRAFVVVPHRPSLLGFGPDQNPFAKTNLKPHPIVGLNLTLAHGFITEQDDRFVS
jgi:hypothetical protein